MVCIDWAEPTGRCRVCESCVGPRRCHTHCGSAGAVPGQVWVFEGAEGISDACWCLGSEVTVGGRPRERLVREAECVCVCVSLCASVFVCV